MSGLVAVALLAFGEKLAGIVTGELEKYAADTVKGALRSDPERRAFAQIAAEARAVAQAQMPIAATDFLDLDIFTGRTGAQIATFWTFSQWPDLDEIAKLDEPSLAHRQPEFREVVQLFLIELHRRILNSPELAAHVNHRLIRAIFDATEGIRSTSKAVLGEVSQLRQMVGKLLERQTPEHSLSTLPARIKDFTGRRADLLQLAGTLTHDGRGAISAVCGMGGVGKTSLALEVTHAVAAHFPDGVLFLNLQGQSASPMAPVDAMGALIRQIEPSSGQLAGNIEELTPLYRRILAGRHILLVLDNANDEPQVEKLIPPEPVALLVTSRNRLQLPGGNLFEVGALPEGEAVKLLRTIIGNTRVLLEADLVAIAHACTYLPIALRAAGDFLVGHRSRTAVDYLAELDDDRFAALPKVERVLTLSIEVLEREKQELVAHFDMLPVFPSTFDRDAAVATWEVKPRQAWDGLDELVRRSLLVFDEHSRRYSLHNLYRDLAERRLAPEMGETAAARHSKYYSHILERAHRIYRNGGSDVLEALGVFDLEQSNIRAGQIWAATRIQHSDDAAHLAAAYAAFGIDLIGLRLTRADQLKWFNSQLDAYRKLGNEMGEGDALGNIGIILHRMHKLNEALDYHERALEISRKGKNKNGELRDIYNISGIFHDKNDFDMTVRLASEVLEMARALGDEEIEGGALGRFGEAWLSIGKSDQAMEFQIQRLALARKRKNRRGEANALGDFGRACIMARDFPAAIDAFLGQASIADELGDRWGKANALSHLAQAFRDFGKDAKDDCRINTSIEYYDESIIGMHNVNDFHSEGILQCQRGLALIYLNDATGAWDSFSSGLRIGREVGDLRTQASALMFMARMRQLTRETDTAILIASEAYRVLRRIDRPMIGEPTLADAEDLLKDLGIDPSSI